MKIRLSRRDWLVVGITAFYMVNVTITRFVLWSVKTCTDMRGTVESTVRAFEMNPFAADVIKHFNFWGYILSYFILPGSIIAVYILARRRFSNELLNFVVITLFFSVMANFANDFGVMLGVLF